MDENTPLAPLEDAATVVLLRDGVGGPEVLMLERPGAGAFAGAWVFPGGKVDPEDRIAAGQGETAGHRTAVSFNAASDKTASDKTASDAAVPDTAVPDKTVPDAAALAAARIAGVREVAEETGQQLAADALVHLANWVPMRVLRRRFRTWFFVAEAPAADVVLNPGEHAAHAWLTPARALARHAAGEMLLVPPTWVTLHHLAGAATVAEVLAGAAAAGPEDYNSYVLKDDGGSGEVVVWSGDEAYPEGGDLAPAGGRHRLHAGDLPWRYERSAAPGPR